jgi:hypothetical protein
VELFLMASEMYWWIQDGERPLNMNKMRDGFFDTFYCIIGFYLTREVPIKHPDVKIFDMVNEPPYEDDMDEMC